MVISRCRMAWAVRRMGERARTSYRRSGLLHCPRRLAESLCEQACQKPVLSRRCSTAQSVLLAHIRRRCIRLLKTGFAAG